jgi:hypothetical protein
MPLVFAVVAFGALVVTSTDITETLGIPRTVDRYL